MAEQPITTIQQGKEFLRAKLEEGANCPCCEQRVKLYRRKLNHQMARALIMIYRYFISHPQTVWLDVNDFLLKRGVNSGEANVALLRHWGLIERKPDAKEDGNPSVGMYSITHLGRQFVEGRMTVPEAVYLYNQKRYRRKLLDIEQITIRQALANKFDYDELMRGF